MLRPHRQRYRPAGSAPQSALNLLPHAQTGTNPYSPSLISSLLCVCVCAGVCVCVNGSEVLPACLLLSALEIQQLDTVSFLRLELWGGSGGGCVCVFDGGRGGGVGSRGCFRTHRESV